MGTVIQRGVAQYRAQIRRAGQSMSKTFESRKEAEEWLRIIEGKITGGEVIPKQTTTTLAQACEWMDGQIPNTPDAQNAHAHFRYWKKSEFAAWALTTIHDWSLIEWRKKTLDEENGEDGGVGPGALLSAQTCIHRLNALSKLFQVWGRAHRTVLDNPVKPGVRPAKPDGRSRRLTPEDERRLLDAADRVKRPWLRHAIIIALETAMRQSEQQGLAWQNINLEQGYADLLKTKNERARRVPLSVRARIAFGELKENPRPFPVATRHGIFQAFMDARELCKLDDLRWHDLRHEAICRLFEQTDFRDHEIMAISGHLTPAMLSRYTHLRPDKLADRLPGGKLNVRSAQPQAEGV